MKHMILGGGGVFGNQLAGYFLKKGEEVVAVGRSPRLPEHFSLGIGEKSIDYKYRQIHITHQVDELIALIDRESPDTIINFAALAYANSWDAPGLFYATNLIAPVALLEKIDDSIKFVQIGSSEVYGATRLPARETCLPNPTSPYAVSKLAIDQHLLTLDRPFTIIRPSNCYGEGQYTYRIIPKAILRLMENEKFPLEGGGKAEKSFMHTDDLSAAVDILTNLGENDIYNVGPQEPISMLDIVLEICAQLKKDPEHSIEVVAGRNKEDARYWVDSYKVKALGWEQKVDFEEGIARMISWCSDYKEELLKEPQSYELRP